MADKQRNIHGNKAKVAPNSKIIGQYITNMVTLSSEKDDETPTVSDENVTEARKFAEENKK